MSKTSDAANRALTAGEMGYPEMDDQEDIDFLEDEGIYDYARIYIVDSIGTDDFKNTFLNLINDIKLFSFQRQRIFCQNMLEKVFDVYDFSFSETFPITTKREIKEVFEFIKFIEFDNSEFLSYIWEVLKVDITKIDIELTSKRNENKIIKETEEQVEANDYNEMINLFLRTYYKDKYIEWFIRESENSKTDIKLKILEREGKLNA